MKSNPNQRRVINPFRGCLGTKDKALLIEFIRRFLGVSTETLVSSYISSYHHVIKHEGRLAAAKRFKSIYNVALRYAGDLEFKPIPFLRADKDNFPKVIKSFKKYLKGTTNEKRAALTVLQLYKLYTCDGRYSLDSIIRPYEGKSQLIWYEAYKSELKKAFPPSQLRGRISLLRPALHISTRNGPNGPAILNAPIDREAIRGTKIEAAVLELAKLTNNRHLSGLMNGTSSVPSNAPRSAKKQLCHSRLRVKHEAGGKARIFAILDYFSQSALKPIHDVLMYWLQTEREDGTSNHSIAAKTVRKWTNGSMSHDLWSFDLTTATDRFPLSLQLETLAAIFGQEIADLWKTIIADRDFIGPNGETGIRFAVGQPLGALSSWATFAITHHILVRTAASLTLKQGMQPFYRIIGDDICIARDRAVASKYREMLDDLGVQISLDKSVVPHQMKSKPAAELAKRLFVGGEEITPVPPDAIIQGWSDKRQLLITALDRGYKLAGQVYPVQSILTSQSEWALLTFPIGRQLPQANEVKLVMSRKESNDEGIPCGFDPGWLTWSHLTQSQIEQLFTNYIRIQVNCAVVDLLAEADKLYDLVNNPLNKIDYQGGDWNPKPWDLHPMVYPVIAKYLEQTCKSTLIAMKNSSGPNKGQSIVDQKGYWAILLDKRQLSYQEERRLIAAFKAVLGPKPVFFAEDFRDEKRFTKVYSSKIIRCLAKYRLAIDPVAALDASLKTSRGYAHGITGWLLP
jgi:hypothetical protein